MLNLETIGVEVRAARKAKRLTQTGLAELSGVSRAQIERLENGRGADMGFGIVLRLVRAVGLDLNLVTFNRGRPTLDELLQSEQS